MGAAPILTILRNGETVASHELEGESLLGRADGCVIRLDDRAISRQHAVFRPTADGVQVEKKSEFAPLLVNGAECTTAVVKEGDVINIGPYLMRVSIPQDRSPPQAATPAHEVAPPSLAVAGSDAGGGAPSASGPELAEISADGSADAAPASLELGNGVEAEQAPADAALSMDQLVEESPGVDGSTSEGAGDAPGVEGESGDSGFDPGDEDGKTKLTPSAKVVVKLVFKPGDANVTELELTKDEVSIGRGKNCDIVLNDKKSSRKNTLIRRAGLSFSIKDLDSANGTFVNGVKVTEQELSGGDSIRVGDVDFEFQAQSAEYEARQQDFMPVPEIPEEEAAEEPVLEDQGLVPMDEAMGAPPPALMPPGADLGMAPPGIQGMDPGMAGIPGITGVPGTGKKKQTLLERYRALPKQKQVIYGIAFLVVFYFAFLDEDPEPTKKPKAKASPVATAPTGAATPGIKTFESLTPEQQRFVETQHALAFDYYRGREFDKALFEIRKIFPILPEYKDAKEIERYAIEGKRKLEALEEEKRKKEEEAKFKAKLQELIVECGDRMQKKQYPQAKELFSQILAMEPDNQKVVEWQRQIQAEDDAKKEEESRKRMQEELVKQAWDLFNAADQLRKKGKCHDAIEAFGKVDSVTAVDKKPIEKAKAGIRACKAFIKNRREPALAEARQLESAGDLTKAFAAFKKATVIDPPHPEGYKGMARIRAILHERAKVIYTEAALEENYSNFAKAIEKFKEVIEVTPADDSYHSRAKARLQRYPANLREGKKTE